MHAKNKGPPVNRLGKGSDTTLNKWRKKNGKYMTSSQILILQSKYSMSCTYDIT